MIQKKRSTKKKTGNEVILKVRNSRKTYILIYFMIIILIAILVYIKIIGKSLDPLAFKLVLAFSVASLIATEIHRLYNVYEIDENSLVHTMGYLTKKSRKMDFSAISDLFIIQNLWQRLFSYGNIEVRMFSGETSTHIKNINKPAEFVDIVLGKINREIKGE